MVKIDPYRSKERYLRVKQNDYGLAGISVKNADSIRSFLEDMEHGLNVAAGSKKGARSYLRLNTLRIRMLFLARQLEARGVRSLVAVCEQDVHALFGAMRSGELRKRDGGVYRSTCDYVKVFKTFWHWHMRVARKCGGDVRDVCIDLDASAAKAPWVYLTDEQVGALCREASYRYEVLIQFLFDSGIRSPTELVNVRCRDLRDGCAELRIRDETSKTFGRTIKLLRCAALVRAFVQDRQLQPDDRLFPICPSVVNRYLKRLAVKVLGTGESRGGECYSRLTMYDFRHSSACYWLPLYQSEAALKYRFGWKQSDMIYYYTELVGMRDTITADDLPATPSVAVADSDMQLQNRQLTAHVVELQSQLAELRDVVRELARKPT